MSYLALADKVFDGAGDVLHRHIRVNAVLIKQIDAVGLEVAASNSRAPGPTDQSHPGTASSSAATLTQGGTLPEHAACWKPPETQLIQGGPMRIPVAFIGIGLIFLICGMAFGMWMGATENFQFADAHAHWNLLGFVVPTIYGLIHRAYPNLARSRLAWPQCIAHFVGVLIFAAGLVVVIRTGNPSVVISGAILVLLATLTYAVLFLTSNREG